MVPTELIVRLALIADAYPPLRSSAAVQLRDLSVEFARQGHEVTMLVASPELQVPWNIEDCKGVQVVRLKTPQTKDIDYVRRTIGEFLMPFSMLRNLRKSPLANQRWEGVVWYSPTIFLGPIVSALKKSSRVIVCRKSEIFGLADSLLTAGPEVNSRNAPTIPKIAISTRGYFQLTDMLGVNAYLAHGWFGTDPYSSGPFLHEKFVYFRFGDTWPDDGVNFYAGIHDNCIWGGKGQPSSFTDYLKVVSGHQGGSNAVWYDQENSLGDHKGTLETALQFKGADRDWYLYGMTMFEETGGFRLFQPGDWLVGASLTFKDPDSMVQRLNVECIDTRKQSAGALNTELRFSGQYGGWVHEGYGIGMPFIPFVQGPGNTWYPLNLIKAYSGAVLTRFGPMMNPLFRISWVDVYGSDPFVISQIPADKLTSTLSLSLANTMHINRTWSLSQQFSADFSKNTTPAIGAFFSISKTWR